MDILIRGAGFENKGAEAMLRTVEAEMGRRLEDSRFYLQITEEKAGKVDPGQLRLLVKPASKLKKVLFFLKTAMGDMQLVKCAFTSFQGASQVAPTKDVDGVIDISGFAYSDQRGVKESELTAGFVEYFEGVGKPYVFLPQAWGPFEKPAVAKNTRKFAGKASLVYVRDEQSYDYVNGLMGEEKANIEMAPDIAFLFKGSEAEVGRRMFAECGVEAGERPLVGLVPNIRVYERIDGEGADNLYVGLLVDIALGFIKDRGCDVVLMPHNILLGKNAPVDDIYLCDLIRSAVEEKVGEKRLFVTRADHSAEDIKSAIGQLDFLVGSRYHSLIAALSSCVPAVALGWSHKYEELMGLVGLGEDVLDYSEMSKSAVMEKVADAWRRREESKVVLEKNIPKIKQNVSELFDEVAEIIQKSSLWHRKKISVK